MNVFKFLHTADWHLRGFQYGRADRGLDFTQAAGRLVDKAIALKVHAIFNVGDVFDSRYPEATAVEGLSRLHRRLVEAGIPMYIVPGNHDMTSPHWGALFEEPQEVGGIKVLDGGDPIVVPGTNVTVFGLGYRDRGELLRMIAEHEIPACDIMLWHGAVREFVGFPMDNALEMLELPAQPRAILLGDIHVYDYREIFRAPDTTGQIIGYPGSIELCSNAEEAEKSATLIEWPLEIAKISRVAIPTRKAVFLRIVTEQDLEQALTRAGQEYADAPAKQKPMFFVRYNGRVNSVVERFRTVIDCDKCIFRAQLLAVDGLDPAANAANAAAGLENRAVGDFMTGWIPQGTPVYALAQQLLDPEAPVREILKGYVNKRLETA